MPDRILILSANFGSGHLQAGLAVAEACRRSQPGCEAEAINVHNRVSDLATSGYMRLLEYDPGTFRSLYNAPPSAPVRTLVRAAFSTAVRQEIARFQPTAVVATHPFPGLAAAHLRATGHLAAPLAMVLTDFVPHPLWAAPGVDRYFVASAEAAAMLERLGVAPGRVLASGIPVRAGFAPGERTGRRILVMGGGLGLGPMVEAVRSFAELPGDELTVTVVCGRNEALRADMLDLFGDDSRMEILGQTDEIPRLMSRSDLLVTKPGGLTCSEALATGLPMLLLSPLPGHEEENARYLERTGAAALVSEATVGRTALGLLRQPGLRLQQMRSAALQAGRPGAAAVVAARLVRKDALAV